MFLVSGFVANNEIPSFNLNWKKAKKVKGLKAKHINDVLKDISVFNQLLIRTIEGNQELRTNSMVCIGQANDAWQQDSVKLLKKYDVVSIDENGWLNCVPKPENEVFAAQMTEYDVFSIYAQWGEKQHNGKFLQHGVLGDYVLHNPNDPNDYWIVQKKIFESTYDWV